MTSLYNQPLAVNYNKAYTSTNFGGRQLTFLAIYAFEDWYAGDPALSAIGNGYPNVVDTGGYNKLWTESGSRYEIAVNAIGSVAEIFFLGEPMQEGTNGPSEYPEETFIFAIATDTRDNWWYTEGGDDEEVDENHEATSLHNALVDALGHDAFTIYTLQAQSDYFGGM